MGWPPPAARVREPRRFAKLRRPTAGRAMIRDASRHGPETQELSPALLHARNQSQNLPTSKGGRTERLRLRIASGHDRQRTGFSRRERRGRGILSELRRNTPRAAVREAVRQSSGAGARLEAHPVGTELIPPTRQRRNAKLACASEVGIKHAWQPLSAKSERQTRFCVRSGNPRLPRC